MVLSLEVISQKILSINRVPSLKDQKFGEIFQVKSKKVRVSMSLKKGSRDSIGRNLQSKIVFTLNSLSYLP